MRAEDRVARVVMGAYGVLVALNVVVWLVSSVDGTEPLAGIGLFLLSAPWCLLLLLWPGDLDGAAWAIVAGTVTLAGAYVNARLLAAAARTIGRRISG